MLLALNISIILSHEYPSSRDLGILKASLKVLFPENSFPSNGVLLLIPF